MESEVPAGDVRDPRQPDRPAAGGDHGFSAVRPLVLGFLTVAVLLGGALGWGATASISGSVIAGGRVDAESRDQVVEHIDGGIVREVLVANGDRVAADDVLIRLDNRQIRSEEAILEAELAELTARRNRLEAEFRDSGAIRWEPELLALAEDEGVSCADTHAQDEACKVHAILSGQRRLFEARRASRAGLIAQLRERVTQTERQVASLEAQGEAVARQIGFLLRELEGFRELYAKQVTRLPELMAREREAASLEGQAGDIGARIAAARSRIAEGELQILQIGAQRIEQAEAETREVQAQENEVRERLSLVRDRLARMEIRAPVAGDVFDMRVFASAEVVRPGEPVLRILPDGASLVVRASVEPIHIDQVWRGQEAAVLFPAFTQRTTPVFEGRVLRVAADASEDARTGLSWFEIEVAIGAPIGPPRDLSVPGRGEEAGDTASGRAAGTSGTAGEGAPERREPDTLERDPASDSAVREAGSIPPAHAGQLALAPGMPAEVHLRTGERSPLSYLLKPLTDHFSRAFREE